MKPKDSNTTRRVTPRKWALLGTVAATGIAVAMPGPVQTLMFPAAHAAGGEAGEAGEAGESGLATQEGPAGYLTHLGLFAAAHRIVAELYAQGEVAQAQEHLEASHHAYYEDIEHELEEYDAPQFEDETEAFADAVMSGADAATVAAAAETVLAAITTAGNAAAPTLKDRILAMKDLMAVAAADFEGGVEEGAVTFAMEYRDAWGFVETVRADAETLAASSDASEAEAGKAVLEQIATVDPLFNGVTTDTAGTDVGLLAAAAGWIEIIALKAK